jgi:type I restriction enzyme S subunit
MKTSGAYSAEITVGASDAGLSEAAAGRSFDVQRFIENFPVLIDAPNAITRLRQLVLGLALNGRLIGMAPVCDLKHRLPQGWRWARIDEIADCVLGKMLDHSKHTRGTKRAYLRNINVRWWTCNLTDLLEMYFEDDELERYGVQPGDVLICEGGEPGRAAIWTSQDPMLIQKAIHRVRPADVVIPEWIVFNLRYDSWTSRIDKYFTGATIKHFTGKALGSYTIPLPPLAEQKRIVAKVDELMRLLDDLEAKQAKKRETQARLQSAALDALTTAEGPEGVAAAWGRVAGNFEVLFDGPEGISDLRQAIVDMAVAGEFGSSVERPLASVPLRNVIVDTRYGTAKKCTPDRKLTPVLRIPNVVQGVLDLGELKYTALSDDELAQLQLHRGDLLVVRSNGSKELVGRPCVVDDRAEGFAYAGYLIRVRVDQRRVKPEWVQVALRSTAVRRQIEKPIRTTSGVHNINTTELMELSFPVPPLDEQVHAIQTATNLLQLCNDLEAKLRRADETAGKLIEAVVAEMVAA